MVFSPQLYSLRRSADAGAGWRPYGKRGRCHPTQPGANERRSPPVRSIPAPGSARSFQSASLSENIGQQQQITKSVWFEMEVIIDPREIKLLFSFPRDGASHMQGAPLGKTRLGHREEPSVPFCQHQDGGESPQHLALLAFFLLMCPCGKHGLIMK